jgi:hypothetical protein
MKAVLVVDMPTTCEDCPCCITHENQYGDIVSARCGAIYKGWIDERTFEKHKLCPLKPIPRKKQKRTTHEIKGAVKNLIAIGYNRCLDDITGDEE